ncbi:MAG TPA: PfkB family carbohydrate kinase, partial [Thermomonas sp.]|nr:PfkB family carbohydrate kinase [Thermomonas sp.]
NASPAPMRSTMPASSIDGAWHACPSMELAGIVDRIGAGDAFAAGVLHGLLSGMDDADSLAFGLASGVLKHYLPGDACTLAVDEVMALVNGERLDVRR